jgi:5-epi-alpha-selinene synthase
MKTIAIPDLYCPLPPSKANQYLSIIEEHSIKWLQQLNLFKNETIHTNFSKSKFFLLASYVLPECELEELKILNDWLSLMFTWDDQCDLLDLKTNPELLKFFQRRFIEILQGQELTDQDHSLSLGLKELRQRIYQRANNQSFHYFLQSFEGYLQGCFEEAMIRVQGIVPDIDTYMKSRNLSVGVRNCLALSEILNNCTLSDTLREQETVQQINQMAVNIIAWSNDIFSVSRELKSQDVHNLVIILHKRHKMPLEYAVQHVAEMHNLEVKKLLALQSSLPSFGENLDHELAKYISMVNSWIRGNLDWSSRSIRYQNMQALEIIN